MSRIWIFAALLFALPFICSGRPQEPITGSDKPLRIEIPAQSDKETYRTIPCGEAGMVLFYKSVETTADNATRWYFTYYDRNLERIWVKSAPILSYMDYRKAVLDGDTVTFYFEAEKKSRNLDVTFQILRIILHTGNVILNNGKTPGSGTMAMFEVVGQKACIGVNTDENTPSVLVMDLPTGQPSVIRVPSDGPSRILHGTVDRATHEISLLVSRQVSKRITELFFIRLQPDGTQLVNTRIGGFDAERSFGQVTDISTSVDESLVAGTYTTATGKKAKEAESSGFFTAPVINTFQGQVGFFHFLDLKNIRQLLSERDILSLRKKSIKKSHTDQEYSLDFSLLLHDILVVDDQYILAAEAYYAQYHTESFTDYDFYGRPFTNSYSVFDGYRFTGIILSAFGRDGKLLWDNAMSIRDLISFDLEPKVTVYPSGEEIILSCLSEGKIACRIIRNSETIEKTTYSDLELMSSNDRLLNESRSGMVHWYDTYFLCSGYQEIRDISKGTNDKRMVFFCNKLRFDR